ncbi:MAG: hypothetical protein P8Z49_11865 [Acidobacteriota bacterium]
MPHLHLRATNYEAGEFGIQWMYFEPECPLPALVRRVAHPAFEVEDLDAALDGRRILVAPNSPSPGIRVAMIEDCAHPWSFSKWRDPPVESIAPEKTHLISTCSHADR